MSNCWVGTLNNLGSGKIQPGQNRQGWKCLDQQQKIIVQCTHSYDWCVVDDFVDISYKINCEEGDTNGADRAEDDDAELSGGWWRATYLISAATFLWVSFEDCIN